MLCYYPDQSEQQADCDRADSREILAMQKQHALEGQPNLQTVHADALPWIVHALYPAQVEQFFILYPNPEPHNPAQRWLNMPFLSFIIAFKNWWHDHFS